MSGAKIRTKTQQVCKRGDFIVAEMDAKVGGYGFIPPELDGAIVSNHYYLYEVDVKHLHPPYLWVVCQAGILQQQIVAKGSTNYASVRSHTVLSWTIPLPDMNIQIRIAKNFEQFSSSLALLNDEITHQEARLTKLKQAILHEAIQGKLTTDWRKENSDVEPASQLLERIQKEKQHLIAEKKIRREKPLSPITPEEIPFEIPDSWVWCRLGDLCEKTGSGSTPRGGKTAYVSSGIPFLRSQNIHNDGVVLDGLVYIPEYTHTRMRGTVVYPRDVLLNITGGSIGRSAIVHDEFDEANINQHVSIIRPVERDMGQFVHKVLISSYFQNMIVEVQTGAGREGLPKNKMDRILIPTPSLDEQVAIIERVEALMDFCRQLETEIKHSRTHAENLLQAVLKEAFTAT